MASYQDFYYKIYKNTEAKHRLIFLHGWGLDHKSLEQIATYFTDRYEVILIDQYGCGKSKAPNKALDSFAYAEIYQEFIQTLPSKENIWIGHSYGARVIIQIATSFPELVEKAVFIAGAGLKRKRSIYFKIKAKVLKLLGSSCKIIDKIFNTKLKEAFANKFGSSDYKAAKGFMRETLIKAVTEDLSNKLANIHCPILLLYGSQDNVTPPEFGQTFEKAIKNSKLIMINGADHNSILSSYYPQLQNFIEEFLD
jgi:pimeloyl-ACP methyl ester carboxylesterase